MKLEDKLKKEHVYIMIGLLVSLVSIAIFSSAFSSSLSFISGWIVSAFGFIGYWLLIPALFLHGIYIMFRRQLYKFRIDISLVGVLLIIVMFQILSSYWGSPNSPYWVNNAIEEGSRVVDFKNFIEVLRATLNEDSDVAIILRTGTGGGFVGYFLLAVLTQAFTVVGMQIITWLIIIVGACLIFNRQLKKLFVYIFKREKGVKRNNRAASTAYNAYPEENFDEYAELSTGSIKDEYAEPSTNTRPSRKRRKEIMRSNLFSDSGSQLINPNKDDDILSSDSLIFANDFGSHNPNEPQVKQQEEMGREERQMLAYRLFQQNSINTLKKAHFGTDYQEEARVEMPTYPNNMSYQNPAFSQNNQQNPSNFSNFSNEEVIETPLPPFLNKPQNNSENSNVSNNVINASFSDISSSISPNINNGFNNGTSTYNNNQQQDDANDPLFVPKAKRRPQYTLPPLDLLDYHEKEEELQKNRSICEERLRHINQIFEDFRIGAEVVSYTIGPSVTRFNVRTNANVSVSTLTRYINDIASRLGGLIVRFEPVVQGQSTSGLELPNTVRTTVGLRETLEKMPLDEKRCLDVPFCKNITGDLIHASLGDFPHMLIAGTTGSGKSIFMHGIILSLIMRNRPEDLKIVLVDPKRVELTYYRDIPHLLCPIINEASEAKVALEKLVDEMERRYSLFQKYLVRDIKEFNKKCKAEGLERLPYIVLFVDEYADLSSSCRDIGTPVVRIGQKARAAGIHLVIATQRPEVKIITGDIKANLPTRVALMVGSAIDSGTIIGEGGAEKLLGNGDMLIDCSLIAKGTHPRVQGCFVETSELVRVCNYLRNQMQPQFDERFLDLKDHSKDAELLSESMVRFDKEQSDADLYSKVVEICTNRDYVSISYIQRTFSVGFPKAGKLFQRLQEDGYVDTKIDSGRGARVIKGGGSASSE